MNTRMAISIKQKINTNSQKKDLKIQGKRSSKKKTVEKKKKSQITRLRRIHPKLKPMVLPLPAVPQVVTSKIPYGTYYAVGALLTWIVLMAAGYQFVKLKMTIRPDIELAESTMDTIDIGSSERLSNQIQDPQYTQAVAEITTNVFPEFQKAQSLTWSERIDYWSQFLQDKRSSRKKIANLAKYFSVDDRQPLVPEVFSPLTFVETVTALSRSATPHQLIHRLIEIRYQDAKPHIENRNFFPELDWISNNQKLNILTDITSQIAKSESLDLEYISKWMDREAFIVAERNQWQGNVKRQLASIKTNTSSHQIFVQLPYLPLNTFKKVMQNLPQGTVVHFVHQSVASHPSVISHQGIILQKMSATLFRYANTLGRIETVELGGYLNTLEKKYYPDSEWPILGVNLNQIHDSNSVSSLRRESI